MTPMVRMQAAALDRQAGETSPVASMPQPSDTLALISGGGEIAVDNDAPAAVLPPIIVRLAGGGFALIWADYSSATAPATTIIEARIYNAAGVAQGAAFTVNTSVHSGTPQISAVALTNGGFAVSWVDDSEGAEPSAVFRGDPATVRSQAFNASGTRVGAEQAVSSVDAAMQTTCRVIGLDNGGYAVVWTDWTADETRTNDVANGRSDIGIRFYGANGAPAGGAAHVNAAGFALRGVKDMVALSDGRFMLVWSATSEGGAAQSGLKGQLFSAGGAPVGNEIALSPASVGSDGQVRAVDGGFVVVWTVFGSSSTRHDVFTQAFTNEGVARGSATQANTTTPGSQQQIQVTTLADGNYVIIWTDRTNGGASADGSASGVQARVFRADGTPLSGQIQVNTATEGVQQSPRVVALAGGGFVIVWEDHSAGVGGAGGDTSQTAVKAQVYAEDGQPVGGEILVNVTTTGFQGSANVAALAGGGFVVSWVGSPDGGAYQHFARVFSVTADTINGTSGDDTLGGGAGAEIINGLAGNDTLNGGSGADIIDGGAGIDRLYGGTGNDTFYADVAADLIFEGVGEGTDTVIASAGFYLYANIENLTLAAGSGDFFGVGNDLANVITGNAGGNLLIAGGGIDTVNGGLGNDAIYGQDGADVLNGEAGIDYIVGGIGNDVIDGGADADNLFGEDGNDTLIGGAGFVTDIMTGGAGNDTLRGDSTLGDYDLMDGGADNDAYYVDTGDDLTFEAIGGGTDTVYADVRVTNGGVYLYANVENLVLIGTTAFGVGNELDNRLTGNASGNYLLGGAGADTINGGAGNDVLFGEGGNDVFAFSVGSGGDVIGDFQTANDRMDVSAFFTSFAQAQANFSQVGNDGAINLGNGDFIVLHGVTMANLTAGHFIFGGAGAPVEAEGKDGGPQILPGVMDDGFIPGLKGDDDGREVLPGAADREGFDLFDLDGIVGDRAWTGLEHRLATLFLETAEEAPELAPGIDNGPPGLPHNPDPWAG